MPLSFGWNQSLLGVEVDWALAAQGATFAYLGADSAYLDAEEDAIKAGLLVGPYWTLESDLDPKGQAALFLSRIGKATRPEQLPPAVFVKRASLQTLKTIVELVEQNSPRRVLIGGTPESLGRIEAGLVFGRTNRLWISHKPIIGGPSVPKGWPEFSLWQTPPPRPLKGVSVDVGYNVAADNFIRVGRGAGLVLGTLGVLAVGAAIYYAGKKSNQ